MSISGMWVYIRVDCTRQTMGSLEATILKNDTIINVTHGGHHGGLPSYPGHLSLNPHIEDHRPRVRYFAKQTA